jgi:NAD(P)-dependent dehydrogenase (short-subunit alcohol dehydrogenase family)
LAGQPEAVPIDYGVSKAAVLSLTKALARSEGPNIRINAVAPGPIWSEFWTAPGGFAETMGHHYNMPPKEAVEHEMRQRQLPMQRLGTTEEVANVVVLISSDLASFVTGSVWGVDGGSIRSIIWSERRSGLASRGGGAILHHHGQSCASTITPRRAR